MKSNSNSQMIHSDIEVVETIINKEVVNQGKHFSGNRNDTFFVADLCTVRPIPNTETVFARSNRITGTPSTLLNTDTYTYGSSAWGDLLLGWQCGTNELAFLFSSNGDAYGNGSSDSDAYPPQLFRG